MSKHRKIFWGIGWTISLLFLGASVGAQEYPNKPISLIIQYPPGGSTDLTARAMANAAKKYLGQPIICENKAGGGGTVGVAYVTTRPADGYTLGIVSSSPTIAYHMGKLNFNPLDDVTHIIRWGWYLFGIVVRADSEWKTLPDLIQYAKQNPQKISYGSPGVGTPPHLAAEELAMAAGMQWTHVPYKGIAENNTALLGGHIDVVSDSSGWAPLVDAGNFRLLATWGFQRCSRYPNVPTVKETGVDVVCAGPLGLMGPKGIPKPIVAKIQDAFKKALDDPEFLAVMKKMDMDTVYLNSADYEKYMRKDSERIQALVKKLG
ncbi:MAG: tripartite tricarboxylate transporter substrate binding protein, partial [Deltaproteobacteria bacterium]|nr:tripartite tricarboxylate transporter substrate binding protein [Deltaproteobacteria bacterium]